MEYFVYGTLTDSDTAASILDSFEYRGTATLQGLHRVDGEYPTLLPGGSVETYVGNPERLGISETWPGEGPFSAQVRTYLSETDVTVQSGPDSSE